MPQVEPMSLALMTQREPSEGLVGGAVAAGMPSPRQRTSGPVVPASRAPEDTPTDAPAAARTSRSFVDFRPDNTRVVQMRVGDLWLYGTLEGFGPGADGSWRGLVRWTEHPGREQRRWFDESDLRPLQV